jgi:hypothetical protein
MKNAAIQMTAIAGKVQQRINSPSDRLIVEASSCGALVADRQLGR